jgi:hypothetical protein
MDDRDIGAYQEGSDAVTTLDENIPNYVDSTFCK